jgi:hypothetical protein
VRGKTGHFFGIYDCPKHLINACMVPLLWANLIASPPCEEGCCGDCADSWLLEYWQDGRFPLQPFEVCMMLINDLGLTSCYAEYVPQAWAPFCFRHMAQPMNEAPPGTQCQLGDPSMTNDDASCSVYFQSSKQWLKDQMQLLPEPEQYDQFYNGWMDAYKEEHGVYPRDSARHFGKVAECCLREIREERNGGAPQAPANE